MASHLQKTRSQICRIKAGLDGGAERGKRGRTTQRHHPRTPKSSATSPKHITALGEWFSIMTKGAESNVKVNMVQDPGDPGQGQTQMRPGTFALSSSRNL